MLLKAVGQPLGTAEMVLESRWEMPKHLPTANRRGAIIAQWLMKKTWQFSFISSEPLNSCLYS
jgi:hypothetical protein